MSKSRNNGRSFIRDQSNTPGVARRHQLMMTELHSHSTLKGLFVPCNDQDLCWIPPWKKKRLCLSFVVSCKKVCLLRAHMEGRYVYSHTHTNGHHARGWQTFKLCIQAAYARTHALCFMKRVAGPGLCFLLHGADLFIWVSVGHAAAPSVDAQPKAGLESSSSICRTHLHSISQWFRRFLHRELMVTTSAQQPHNLKHLEAKSKPLWLAALTLSSNQCQRDFVQWVVGVCLALMARPR